jgi:hypothetical protein
VSTLTNASFSSVQRSYLAARLRRQEAWCTAAPPRELVREALKIYFVFGAEGWKVTLGAESGAVRAERDLVAPFATGVDPDCLTAVELTKSSEHGLQEENRLDDALGT